MRSLHDRLRARRARSALDDDCELLAIGELSLEGQPELLRIGDLLVGARRDLSTIGDLLS